jgi:choline dehydrogenase-like flavoprotein
LPTTRRQAIRRPRVRASIPHPLFITEPALAGLCGALLDLDAPGAALVVEDLGDFLRFVPPPVRSALAAGAVALDAFAVLTTGRRLRSLPAEHRQHLLDRLGHHRAAAQLVEALKIPVVTAYGAGAHGNGRLERPDHAPARPDGDLNVIRSAEFHSRAVADAVVVGSGAGGAIAARELARAGLSVIVVEEGQRHGVEEFRTQSALERFGGLYRDGGTTVALGSPPVLLPMGRGVGGTTLVNSGTCYRTPASVLRRWRERHGVEMAEASRFGALLDEIERTLQVAPTPLEVMGNNGRLALLGAERLGWSAHPIRRNAPGCRGCCQCAVGCPENAKFGVHLSVLPNACAAGAVIVSEARVERIMHGAGRATGVRAARPDGSSFEIIADLVFVAAGATETPPLLRRSGLGAHPQLGRNLAIHPAVSIGGWFRDEVRASEGVLQSAGIDELHASDGILIEATSAPAGLGSIVLPGTGPELAEQLARIDHLATIGAMVADAPSGSVHGWEGRPVIRYRLARRDGRRLVRAIEAMGQVLFAAGAEEVVTGILGHERVRNATELKAAVSAARVERLHLAAFHPTGTARMGLDAETHPVDPTGRLRGVDRLYVVDASIVPSCPEVNPQLTIMALAAGVAERALTASRR